MTHLKLFYSENTHRKIIGFRRKGLMVYTPNLHGKDELYMYVGLEDKDVYDLIQLLGGSDAFEYCDEDEWPESPISYRNGRNQHFDSAECMENRP